MQMQRHPTAYVQRMVEQLSFLPEGGQRWERDLQIRLPSDPSLADAGEAVEMARFQPTMRPESKELFIVSLGMYTRSRFADFVVRDANGAKLNLLTRLQHGYCLASSLLVKHLSPQQLQNLSAKQNSFDALYALVFRLFTTVESSAERRALNEEDRERQARDAEAALVGLLKDLGADENHIEFKRRNFGLEYRVMQTVTQYLCWVTGEPGETVNLSASYTMADAPRLATGTSAPALGAPRGEPESTSVRRRRAALWLKDRTDQRARRIRRTAQYARTGLGPLNYELRTPAHDHSASYYFVIKPPEDCRLAYLDWGTDNSIDDHSGEVDCAYHSVHIHNGVTLSRRDGQPLSGNGHKQFAGSKINAFLRADLRRHYSLLVAAVLTIILAVLAEQGQFVADSGRLSSVLLIAPTALLAYLTQRQSHHHAEATSWLPRLMMLYLIANIVFVASVGYDIVSGDTLLKRPDVLDDIISGGMFVTSIALLYWFAAIGLSNAFVERYFRRRPPGSDSLSAYCKLCLRFGDLARLGLIVLVLGGGGALAVLNWGAPRAAAVKAQEAQAVGRTPRAAAKAHSDRVRGRKSSGASG